MTSGYYEIVNRRTRKMRITRIITEDNNEDQNKDHAHHPKSTRTLFQCLIPKLMSGREINIEAETLSSQIKERERYKYRGGIQNLFVRAASVYISHVYNCLTRFFIQNREPNCIFLSLGSYNSAKHFWLYVKQSPTL